MSLMPAKPLFNQRSYFDGTSAKKIPPPENCRRLLDDVSTTLHHGGSVTAVNQQLDLLFSSLQQWKLHLPADDWTDVVTRCRSHAVLAQLHEDPFTHRAYSKPRTYAGDAVMMDYIYSREEPLPVPALSATGRQVFNFTTQAPASRGVRARRRYIAHVIDDVAMSHPAAHVLAIAAGHLREANLSQAIRQQRLGRFVAVDADARSISEVAASYGHLGVEAVVATFQQLITARLDLGQFDLVYSLGLFDYVPNQLAQRLVARMFQMLLPGGRLIVANFLPGIRDVGYMETYMDWSLIYRDEADMRELTTRIPPDDLAHAKLSTEENRNIIFVEATRRT